MLGNLALTGECICFAIFLVSQKPLLAEYSSLMMIAWQFSLGAFFIICFLCASEGFTGLGLAIADAHASTRDEETQFESTDGDGAITYNW